METIKETFEPCIVLLVDDDPFIIDIYTIQFSQHNHIVVACLQAEEALQKLRTGFKPDIIVSDLIMPFVDGFDFIHTMRDEHLAEGVPIVVLSNQDDYTDFEKTKALNVTAHYIKIHSTPAETVALIEGVIAHVRHPDMYPKVPQQW
jgi:two-component system, chemotaxis family, chemotaxis protein CheY